MKTRIVRGGNVTFGGNQPLVLVAGPCVIESRVAVIKLAAALASLASRLRIPYVFKASFDKANRTSIDAFRGPGLAAGLDVLREVKERFGVPVLSDVHEIGQVETAAQVLDVVQIPAFLCRQTDLVVAAAKTGKVVNVKKGQFLAPWDVHAIVRKLERAGTRQILLTERGVCFGYNQLVTDFTSLQILRETGYPVVYDVTHSVQQPGGLGHATGGRAEFIPLLARCGVAAGIDALFVETHANPPRARSDGPNMIAFKQLEPLLVELLEIDRVIKRT